jgi:hypothetical protein
MKNIHRKPCFFHKSFLGHHSLVNVFFNFMHIALEF